MQAQVLSVAQMLEMGVSRRVLERLTKDWVRLGRGLYSLQQPTWEAAAWAGLLHGGRGAVMSGEAACYLHGIARDEPNTLAVWSPTQHPDLLIGSWRVRMRRGDRRGQGLLTRARPEVALLDLANESDENQTVAATAAQEVT